MSNTKTKSEWCNSIEIKIPFHDVDSLKVAWHGNYLRYFEIARCALLNKIDYDVDEMEKSKIIWPVVECFVKYSQPLFYNDIITVTAYIVSYEYKLKIGYEIRKTSNLKRITKGYTIQAPVCAKTNELLFETPKILLKKLGINHDA